MQIIENLVSSRDRNLAEKYNEAIDLLTGGMPVRDVAEQLEHSSPSSFSTSFKNAVGKNPSEYLQGRGLAKKYNGAIDLLRGGISVGDVAEQLGYSSLPSFSTSFKEVVGKNPSEYLPDRDRTLAETHNEAIDLLRGGISVGDVAEQLEHSSPSSFSTSFKKAVGKNPSEYLQGRGLAKKYNGAIGKNPSEYLPDRDRTLAETHNEAIDLLRGGMPVGDVAEQLGYSSPSSFSTSFKKAVGKNPSEYSQGRALAEKYNEAIDLLTGGMPVRDVAEQLEHSSLPSFSMSFKKAVGKNPSGYKPKKSF
ncbi:hypothetical protein CMO93_05875 [Candidatus Woesearchaeota archaeon]|nr:hypothetical protein [Candidatus Woesearchaeota archaeon]